GYPARQLTTVPPSAQGFLPGVPLLAVHPALGGQVTFRDAGGKQVLTTIEASMQSVLYLDPATKRYWAIEAPTVDMRPTFAFLPEGQNYA
ncbi:hypothetical protein GUH28_08835, partial [Xanthomonas citri pv. citri]|nr:hypothetical protein [Xanthomonas citri pv. citri]